MARITALPVRMVVGNRGGLSAEASADRDLLVRGAAVSPAEGPVPFSVSGVPGP